MECNAWNGDGWVGINMNCMGYLIPNKIFGLVRNLDNLLKQCMITTATTFKESKTSNLCYMNKIDDYIVFGMKK